MTVVIDTNTLKPVVQILLWVYLMVTLFMAYVDSEKDFPETRWGRVQHVATWLGIAGVVSFVIL